MAAPRPLEHPLEHTGDSANIAYYVEQGRPPGYVWVSVLRSIPPTTTGKPRRPLPTFHLEVMRHAVGPVAQGTYQPKTMPQPGPLPPRTVSRLVRQLLQPTTEPSP
jgi:hypothetical protein